MGLFNKYFGAGKLKEPIDFSPFGVDMHSHLIPGLDDGVKTVEESLEMIRGLHDLGFYKLITTPHIMNDVYTNSPETILPGLEKVRRAVKETGLNVEVFAAAEYLLDDGFMQKLKSDPMMTIGDNILLVEMSYIMEPYKLDHMLFDIQMAGYRIVIAHAERYSFWAHNKKRFQDMIDRSIYLQLNILSLMGYYGKEVQKTAFWLLENDMYSFAGTDLHNGIYLSSLQELQYHPAMKKLQEKSGSFINHTL
ncbi:MAG: CpsB/CapC family capsule biosynthesis tyrosine phosphatase [Bacteroidales bacterium]